MTELSELHEPTKLPELSDLIAQGERKQLSALYEGSELNELLAEVSLLKGFSSLTEVNETKEVNELNELHGC